MLKIICKCSQSCLGSTVGLSRFRHFNGFVVGDMSSGGIEAGGGRPAGREEGRIRDVLTPETLSDWPLNFQN